MLNIGEIWSVMSMSVLTYPLHMHKGISVKFSSVHVIQVFVIFKAKEFKDNTGSLEHKY